MLNHIAVRPKELDYIAGITQFQLFSAESPPACTRTALKVPWYNYME